MMAELFHRYRQFVIFCLIGAINTGVHFTVAIFLIEALAATQVVANSAAFLVANIGSYLANSVLNFKVSLSLSRYGRFLLSSLSVIILVLVVSTIADRYQIHYLYTLVALTILSPVMSFLMVRYFTFRT